MFPFPNRPTLATLPSLSCVSIISSKSPSLAAVTHIGLVSVRPSFPLWTVFVSFDPDVRRNEITVRGIHSELS